MTSKSNKHAKRRRSDGTLLFDGWPQFRPNQTPAEMFAAGVFGGTYFRPIRSRVLKNKQLCDQHKEFPAEWFSNVDIDKCVISPSCDTSVNFFGVASGSSLSYWEDHGWIRPQDPYGWFQWYCRFFQGRRSPDDERQIGRWMRIASVKNGRWRRFLSNHPNSKKVRQLLLQWGVMTASHKITVS